MSQAPEDDEEHAADAEEAEALLGSAVAGKWRLDSVLGVGGMATVFGATHVRLGDPYALKLLHARYARLPSVRTRFLEEAQAWASLRHAGMVRVYDVDADEHKRPYIVMERLHGETLRTWSRGRARDEVLDRYVEMLDVLAAAHAAGIVHRDLKPDNVFVELDARGAVRGTKLLDFGLARAGTGARSASRVGMGTLAYASPEQARSGASATAASDVWSAGVMLHELLAGARPLGPGSESELLERLWSREPLPPLAGRDGVPRALGELVDACLAKDPLARPKDAAELLARLRAARAAEPDGTRAPAPEARAARAATKPQLPDLGGEASPASTSAAPARPTPEGSTIALPPLHPSPNAPPAAPGAEASSPTRARPVLLALAPFVATGALLALGTYGMWSCMGRPTLDPNGRLVSELAPSEPRIAADAPEQDAGLPADRARAAVAQCRAALAAGRFEEAMGHADEALRAIAGDADATACRDEASIQREERTTFDRGMAAIASGDLEAAYMSFESLPEDSAYRARPEVQSAMRDHADALLARARDTSDREAAVRDAQLVLNMSAATEEQRAAAQRIVRRSRPRAEAQADQLLLGAVGGEDGALSDVLAGGARTDAPPEHTAEPPPPTELPQTPPQAEVRRVLGRAMPQFRACAGDQLGMAVLTLMVRSDGSVASAAVGGSPFAGAPQGACMEAAARALRFSPFREPMFRIQYPVSIR